MYQVQSKEKFRVKYSYTVPHHPLWLQSSEPLLPGLPLKEHILVCMANIIECLFLLHPLIQFNFHHQSHRIDVICIPLKDETAEIKKSINLLNVTQMEKGGGRIQTQAAHVLTSELKLSYYPIS